MSNEMPFLNIQYNYVSMCLKTTPNNKKMSLLEIIKEPWPWYVSGPLIGLTVPISVSYTHLTLPTKA